LASKFEKGKIYAEKEVNRILLNWQTFNDWAMFRRELYDNYFFERKSDGSASLESFGLQE